mgnify:CR=1 FL=1
MRKHKFTRRLALILLVAALLMSLPLASTCAKYVRELYAGSFTLTIQPQGNSHSQDADQSPIQDDKQVTIQEAVPVFDTESGEGAAGAPQAG